MFKIFRWKIVPFMRLCTKAWQTHRGSRWQYSTMYVKRNVEARSCNHFCREKAISFIFYECVFVALSNQHAICMRRNIYLCVPCPDVPFFPYDLTNGTTFEKKLSKIKRGFRISVQMCLKYSHSKKNWARYNHKCNTGLHVKYQLFLSHFNESWNFLDRFTKSTQMTNFMKLRPVGAKLFRADAQTERQTHWLTDINDEANSRFSHFCERAS
jgi:hypothetical protein